MRSSSLGEIGYLPFGVLEGCIDGEGFLLDVIPADYAASETLSTVVPSLEVIRVNGINVPAQQSALIEIPPTIQVTVQAQWTNAAPTSGSINGVAANLDLVNSIITANVPFDSRDGAVAIEAELVTPGVTVRDSVLIRAQRQRVTTRFVTFSSTTAPAIEPDELNKVRRQVGLEYGRMCSAANGVPGSPVQAVLESELRVDSDATVIANDGVALLISQNNVNSPQLRNLFMGLLPNGDPSALIPAPGTGLHRPVRVFVSGAFLVENDGVLSAVNPNTETGISMLGAAYFRDADEADDVVIIQAPPGTGDLEFGQMRFDRPVASGLGHELAHVTAGMNDSLDEDAFTNGSDVDLPTPSQPSVMNSFPYYRSLQVGTSDPRTCTMINQFPDDNLPLAGPNLTESLCARILNGRQCSTPSVTGPFIDFTDF